MNLLKNVLVVIAATAAMGSAHAQNVFNLGPLSPTIQTRTNIYGEGSFADIFNFTVDASYNTVSSKTLALAADGTPSATSVTGLQLELFSGFNAPGTAKLFTGLDLDAVLLTPGEFSARISGTVAPLLRGGYEFSIAATPEPAEWMLLLAGLVGLGFVARRKIGLVAGAPA